MRTPSRRNPSKIESVALLISTRPPIKSERYDCAFCRTRLESVMYQYVPMIAERKTKQQSIAQRRGSETRGRNGLPGRQVRSNNRSGAGRGRLRGIAFTPSPGTPGEGWGEGSSPTTNRSGFEEEPSPCPLPAYRERVSAHDRRRRYNGHRHFGRKSVTQRAY